jgi:alkanesulfonate monooxygenase
VDIYTVTPETDPAVGGFRARLAAATEAAELAGWTGMLVPHNLHEVDPWMVACHVGSVTGTLIPLIAVQPASTPPHTAAASAAAYGALYGRPLYFNLVAGARDDELRRIGDALGHDERYERLGQYGRILRALLAGETVDESTGYYTYRKFRLEPRPDVLAECKIFVAGSSPASMRVATGVADVVVTHPMPYPEWRANALEPLLAAGYTGELGVRIGILCRPDGEQAWRLAAERFPESWTGRQETLLKTRSSNVWSRELAVRASAGEPADPGSGPRDPYWLGAFRSGRASAPFLVGSYSEVAERLADYTGAGVGHLLLNGSEDDDFAHIGQMLRLTAGVAAAAPYD